MTRDGLWHAMAAVVITFTGLLYLPTIGIGEVGNPSGAGQFLLLLPSVVFAGRALRSVQWRSWINSPVALLALSAVWMAASAVQAPEPAAGIARGGWFLLAALGLVAAVAAIGQTDTLLVATITTAVFCFLGIALHLAGVVDGSWDGLEVGEALFPWQRLRGLGANQTLLGLPGVLIMLSPFALRAKISSPMSFLLVTIGGAAVLASHNRSAFGALIVGVLAEAVWARRRWSVVVVSSAVAAVGFVFLLGPSVLRRFERGARPTESFDFYTGADSGVLTGRVDVWSDAYVFGLASPLTGRGNGAFSSFTKDRFENGTARWDPTHAHSVLLEVFADQGVVGLLILAAAGVVMFRCQRFWTPGTAALLGAICAHSMIEPIFSGSPSARWTHLVIIAAVAVPSDHLRAAVDRRCSQAEPVSDEAPLRIPDHGHGRNGDESESGGDREHSPRVVELQ